MRLAWLALACSLVVAGCASTSLPPVTAPAFRFEADERGLWRRAEEEQAHLEGSGLVYGDARLEAYLDEVARRLQPAGVFEVVPFRIRVLKDPRLNAFTLPNGRIYLHTGILAGMENEAQLATLLAHEMTHATHRHAVKQFRNLKHKAAVVASLGAVGGSLAGLLGAVGAVAAVTGYSRDLETEADTEGLRRVAEAGYDLDETPKLFVHLKEALDEDKVKEPFFFGTHPRLQERIESYRTLLDAEYRGRHGGTTNAEVFLGTAAGALLENVRLDLKAGRFKSAGRGVEKLLRIEPDRAEGHFLRGEVVRQKGDATAGDQAIEHYRRAIALDPSYPEPYRSLGLVLYKRGEMVRAREALERYLALSPRASDRGYIEDYIRKTGERGDP
jgi:predicted Zn-dependent protease